MSMKPDKLKLVQNRRNRHSRNRVMMARRPYNNFQFPKTDHYESIEFPKEMCGPVFRVDCYENQGTRPYMEDANRIVINENHSFIGVFDGHGGSEVAKYVSSNLYELLMRNRSSSGCSESLSILIEKSFDSLEEDLFQKSRTTQPNDEKVFSGGSCASIIFIDHKDLNCTSANIGDCETVLFDDDGKFRVLTIDHDTNNESEVERVKNLGVKIKKGGRVGGLKITRSFGDFFRPKGEIVICADPHIQEFRLDPKIHHSIVMASDGLWGNITEKEVFEVIKNEKDPRVASRKLMHKVTEKLRDNITIVVLYVVKKDAFKEW